MPEGEFDKKFEEVLRKLDQKENPFIGLHEMFLTLVAAGFTERQAIWFISDITTGSDFDPEGM